jgi:predicted SAM-dependent methyltransferase
MATDRKINIGAGTAWQARGWEVLDNMPGVYGQPWIHRGKAWDSGLPSEAYDIIFTSHMLEHIPHFRLEKTIAEFNRIMRAGGVIRILVPDLRKAAKAYVARDKSFFSGSRHYSDHMGIGASFLRLIVSPGGQTLALSREMDEIIGGYAHLHAFDFEMLKTVLEKYGFEDVVESKPGESAVEELRTMQYWICNGNRYESNAPEIKIQNLHKHAADAVMSGFDKPSKSQLVVEARKARNVPYCFDEEFDYNKTSRMVSRKDRIKLVGLKAVSVTTDSLYNLACRAGARRIYKFISGAK